MTGELATPVQPVSGSPLTVSAKGGAMRSGIRYVAVICATRSG